MVTKLNKNVLGVTGPILTEVKQKQWDFNKSDQKKNPELSLSNSIDRMKYQETGWHPDVGPPRGRNWKWLARILFLVLNWTESKVIN